MFRLKFCGRLCCEHNWYILRCKRIILKLAYRNCCICLHSRGIKYYPKAFNFITWVCYLSRRVWDSFLSFHIYIYPSSKGLVLFTNDPWYRKWRSEDHGCGGKSQFVLDPSMPNRQVFRKSVPISLLPCLVQLISLHE